MLTGVIKNTPRVVFTKLKPDGVAPTPKFGNTPPVHRNLIAPIFVADYAKADIAANIAGLAMLHDREIITAPIHRITRVGVPLVVQGRTIAGINARTR